jgi:hypothetical protein
MSWIHQIISNAIQRLLEQFKAKQPLCHLGWMAGFFEVISILAPARLLGGGLLDLGGRHHFIWRSDCGQKEESG